jgi:hypothetical protein
MVLNQNKPTMRNFGIFPYLNVKVFVRKIKCIKKEKKLNYFKLYQAQFNI